ncbi:MULTISPECIES: CE1759 family FMN reductase [unclassified Leucobacter]|uniref:CE1759 family FMN reductase n=1 Tax=unclassified Leucobacter TaxID=2621730 RepID=UPI00069B27D6|nr:CE1759 family FMN reductase [Leucobacter sp. Ag1]
MNATQHLAPAATPQRVRLVAVSGGLGSPSSSRLLVDRIVSHAQRSLEAHGIVAETEVVELRELAVEIAHNLVTGFAEPRLRAALDAVRSADGVIAVSPVFNASIAGLFKSFFDLVEPGELRGIPVAMGATGGSARHSLVIEFAMRPLFAYLRSIPMPTGIFAATEEWGSARGSDGIDERSARVARELVDAIRHRLWAGGGTRSSGGDAVLSALPVRGGGETTDAGADASAAASAPGDDSTARMDDDPAAAGAPTIAATTADFSRSSLQDQAKREEHDAFADLMSKFAGTEVGDS